MFIGLSAVTTTVAVAQETWAFLRRLLLYMGVFLCPDEPHGRVAPKLREALRPVRTIHATLLRRGRRGGPHFGGRVALTSRNLVSVALMADREVTEKK